MAPQNRKPHGLALQVPKSGYGFLKAVLDCFSAAAGELTNALDAPHKIGGNPGYPARGMLRVYLLQFLLNQRYANAYLNRLDNDPRLLELCELEQAPSEVAYSRFKNHKLAPRQEELDRVHAAVFEGCRDLVEGLRKQGIIPADAPQLGEYLAVDATDIEAYARPRGEHCDPQKEGCGKKHKHCNAPVPGDCTRRSHQPCADPGARWGYRTRKGKSPKSGNGRKAGGEKEDGKKEFYFGYGADVIADAHYGLPLYANTRPANLNEGPRLRADVDAALKLHPWLKDRLRYLIADAGYAAKYNFEYLANDLKVTPVIAVPRPPKDKQTGKRLYDGTYDKKGRPVCVGGQSMEFVGTDPEGAHLFRCPPEGCRLKSKLDWSRYCHDEHSEKPEGHLLRIMGVLHRASEEWREVYKKRPIIERYIGSGKQSRLLDKHQALGQERVGLHVRMSTLSHLLTSWGRLMAGDYARMRRMTVKLPRVRRAAKV